MSHDRRPGYADLLSALVALRPDQASARFDALLAELLAAGRLDPADARELRWWQRESVRAVGDFLTETAPDLLAGLESSQRQAHDAVAAAAEAWDLATGDPDDEPAAADEPAAGADPDPHEHPATSAGAGGVSWRASSRRSRRPGTIDLRAVRVGSGELDEHDDPDGPYEPVVPRPAPEPIADRPEGARLRKAAADRFRSGARRPGDPGDQDEASVTDDAPTEGPVVVDLRSRTQRPDAPGDPDPDTPPPAGRVEHAEVASPRRRLLLPTHTLTTRTDSW